MKCQMSDVEECRTGGCAYTCDAIAIVLVRAVPMSEEGSAAASGTYTSGAYAQRLMVCEDCADLLRDEYEEDIKAGYLWVEDEEE